MMIDIVTSAICGPGRRGHDVACPSAGAAVDCVVLATGSNCAAIPEANKTGKELGGRSQMSMVLSIEPGSTYLIVAIFSGCAKAEVHNQCHNHNNPKHH